MECTVADYYIRMRCQTFTAVVLVAENTQWKLVRCSPDGLWPLADDQRSGQWRSNGLFQLFHKNGTVDQARQEDIMFSLTRMTFPPELGQRFFAKPFFQGSREGDWEAILSGRLFRAAEEEMIQIQDEIIKAGIDGGIAATSILDPTGAVSVAGAAYSLRNGDYLGCVTYLIGVIPLVGKAATGPKAAAIGERLAILGSRLNRLKAVIQRSRDITREAGLTGRVLKAEVQGATRIPQELKMAGTLTREGQTARAASAPASASAEVSRVASKAGMAAPDALAMQKTAMQSESYVVIRHTSRESLARHGDFLNSGKPSPLTDFHTAHENSVFHGYIVVKRDQMADQVVEEAGVLRLKNHRSYKVSAKACPRTGDRLITRDGEAFFSDYDFMGWYGKDGQPFWSMKFCNDHPLITAWVNKIFPGFRNKVQHGMQDFWFKYKVGPEGQVMEIMGRQPGRNELFVVFEPNGRVTNMNVTQLKVFYNKNRIRWPYDL